MYLLTIKATAQHPELTAKFYFNSSLQERIELLGLKQGEYTQEKNQHKGRYLEVVTFIKQSTQIANYIYLGSELIFNSNGQLRSWLNYYRRYEGNNTDYTVVNDKHIEQENANDYGILRNTHVRFGTWINADILDTGKYFVTPRLDQLIERYVVGRSIEQMAYQNKEVALQFLRDATGLEWEYSNKKCNKTTRRNRPIEWSCVVTNDPNPCVLTLNFSPRRRQRSKIAFGLYHLEAGFKLYVVSIKPQQININVTI